MGKIYDYVVNNTVNENVLKDLDDTSSQSDVSIAHVEFRTLGVHTTAFFTGPFVHHDGDRSFGTYSYVYEGRPEETDVVLYKGMAEIVSAGVMQMEAEGNARVSSASVYITGDCIITMN